MSANERSATSGRDHSHPTVFHRKGQNKWKVKPTPAEGGSRGSLKGSGLRGGRRCLDSFSGPLPQPASTRDVLEAHLSRATGDRHLRAAR